MTAAMLSDEQVIEHTKAWVSSVVVGDNFCPFARKEVDNDTVRYCVARCMNEGSVGQEESALENGLMALIAECIKLDDDAEIETTIVIYPSGFSDFQGFLSLTEIANSLLAANGYEGIYQLASFHPEYCFADSIGDDPANYTNRSPYPALHLIREESIERALEGISNPERIPERNVRYAREKGLQRMREKLLACSIQQPAP
ncbi:DUF1415 domain-containing protein [Alkalimarinus coralli]|uniref:DUF1415 domain-containing protein n=1 Tax=Alkalimarinus coralli TaxID=2935863 RepID=UPI00202BA379|nr:DUF1415 domain-containing protein [Alkalimarinus coralli]